MANPANLNKFKFFFFKQPNNDATQANTNSNSKSTYSGSSRKPSDSHSNRTAATASFNPYANSDHNHDNQTGGRNVGRGSTSGGGDGYNIIYQNQEPLPPRNHFLSPSYSMHSLALQKRRRNLSSSNNHESNYDGNHDDAFISCSNCDYYNDRGLRMMSHSSSKDVRHMSPQEASFYRNRVKVRNILVDDHNELRRLLVSCFMDKNDFYKTVCAVCAKERFKIEEFTKLCRSEKSRNNVLLAKSVSMPAIDVHSPRLVNAGNATASRNRCFFTQAQLSVAQAFKSLDTDYDNKLSFKEFFRGLQNIITKNKNKPLANESEQNDNQQRPRRRTTEVKIDELAARVLFSKFDTNQDGFLDFGEMVQGIGIPMCQKRCNVLIEAFKCLDVNKDNQVDLIDLRLFFTEKGYSLSRKSIYFEENINELAIQSWLSSFNEPHEIPLMSINVSKFLKYFTVISSTVINDSYFDLLIRGCYCLTD